MGGDRRETRRTGMWEVLFHGTLSVPFGWAPRRVQVPEGIPEGGWDLISTAILASRERGHETESESLSRVLQDCLAVI